MLNGKYTTDGYYQNAMLSFCASNLRLTLCEMLKECQFFVLLLHRCSRVIVDYYRQANVNREFIMIVSQATQPWVMKKMATSLCVPTSMLTRKNLNLKTAEQSATG